RAPGLLTPQAGNYSRRGNEKRSYWLGGRILRRSRYRAWNVGIVICRVNPWRTSQHCARCALQGRTVEVAPCEAGKPREGSRAGAPLAWCPVCQRDVTADYNGSRNIGIRLLARHRPIPPASDHAASVPLGPVSAQDAQDSEDLQDAPELREKPPTRLALGASGEAPKGAGIVG